jgi:hypothetical protein
VSRRAGCAGNLRLGAFSREACPARWIAGWTPVRVMKTHPIKNPEPFSFRFFEMEKALVEIFREGANTRRGPKGVSLDPGLARDDRDDPPRRFDRFVFQYRSNVTRDRRSAGLDGSGSAVELRDTETPDFFLVGRLERKHEALLCSRNYYQLVLSVGENSKP